MVIGPGVVSDSIVDELVRIASAFAAELPYRPVFAMF